MSLTLIPHKPTRTAATITLQRDENRTRLSELTEKLDTLTAERTALKKAGAENSPSDLWRLEEMPSELRSITLEIEKAERFEKALACDLRAVELPGARAQAERTASLAAQARSELEQAIRDSIPRVLKLAEKALAAMEEANAANTKAEQLAGETVVFRRFAIDPQATAVLRPMWAYGQEPAEWHSRMHEIGRGIPLGEHHLFM